MRVSESSASGQNDFFKRILLDFQQFSRIYHKQTVKTVEPAYLYSLPGPCHFDTECVEVDELQPKIRFFQPHWILGRGRSKISGKGVCIYKGMGVRFADFISFFLNIP